MSSFVLKIIACFTMFIDHIGYLIYGKISYFNIVGRIAFPIFAFQISEGYIHTKNLKKYIIRLFIFALISQVPYMLFCNNLISDEFALNIFFTLLLGLITILIYDKLSNKVLAFMIFILIALLSELISCDYGFYGITIIFLFYVFKDKKLWMNITFILCTFIKYLIYIFKYGYSSYYIFFFIFTISSLILINSYNNQEWKKHKYFFYLFYPIHLLIIYLLWFIIN